MLIAPRAYKFVAMMVMLAEINYCARRLQLPINLLLTEQDLVKMKGLVVHPNFGGRAFGKLETRDYAFSFGKPGRLIYVIRLEEGYQANSTSRRQGQLRTVEFLPQLIGVPSVIDTKGAHDLATNWLASIEVDVARLEREHPPVAKQWVLKDKWPLPIFSVDWGVYAYTGPHRTLSGPAARVLIAGDTKDLLYLRQEDSSYSQRPAPLLTEVDKLLAISDEEFLKYSPVERSQLVASFAAISVAP